MKRIGVLTQLVEIHWYECCHSCSCFVKAIFHDIEVYGIYHGYAGLILVTLKNEN